MQTYRPQSLLIIFFFFISLFTLVSCGSNRQDETALAPAQIIPVKDTKAADTKFLSYATDAYFHEILLAKLAQQRASDPEVKELGRVIEETSRASKSQITGMAMSKSITVPTAPSEAANIAYDTLGKIAMDEFDFIYLRQFIQRHNDLVVEFENAAREDHDADIQSWASGKVSELRSQLSKAKELDARVNPVSDLVQE
ncbi:MAG TPA: DUF4142 domain-containing protein [Saprospiraceae bacterium]|nr:DUF4142 domain-containing protein [Saprospiraceae bacterium]